MIDLSSSIIDNASFLVFVVGVGDISAKTFAKYNKLITQFDKIKISEMTLNNQSQYRGSGGTIRFRFVNRATVLSELCEFQYHRRIIGIIGIVDCQQQKDLAIAEKQFTELKKRSRFEYVLESRCFAFEPGEDQPDCQSNIILIPNQDVHQVQFYISTMITDFAATLVDKTSSLISKYQSDRGPNFRQLRSAYERYMTPDEQKNGKKKSAGRITKLIADLLLLSGQPNEARGFYQESLDYGKSNSDWICCGSSLEGYAASLVIKFRNNDINEKPTDVIDKLNEAITYYTKVPKLGNILVIELYLKLTRYYCRRNMKMEAIEMLSKAISKENSLTDKDKLSFYHYVGILYSDLGLRRKAAFYNRQLTQLMSKGSLRSQWTAAHILLLQSLPAYSIENLDLYIQELHSSNSTPLKQLPIPGEHSGWPALQSKIFRDVIFASKSYNDPTLTVEYISFALHMLTTKFTSSQQEDLSLLLDSLTTKMSSGKDTLNWTKLPEIVDVIPKEGPDGTKLIKVAKAGDQAAVFIYNPFEKGGKLKTSAIKWIQNDTVFVEVLLKNSMAFEITVEKILLIVSGVEFEAYTNSLVLAPDVSSYIVTLHGKPLQSGHLSIDGIKITTFGVDTSHKIEPIKIEVVPPFPQLCISHHVSNNVKKSRLDLIEGETVHSTIRLENIGSVPIALCELSAKHTISTTSSSASSVTSPLPVSKNNSSVTSKSSPLFNLNSKTQLGLSSNSTFLNTPSSSSNSSSSATTSASSTSASTTAASILMPKTKASLLHFQQQEENRTGGLKISKDEVEFHKQNLDEEINDSELVLECVFLDESNLFSQLPILPGCSIDIPVTIRGIINCTNIVFSARYSDNEKNQYRRDSKTLVNVKVSRILTFSRFNCHLLYSSKKDEANFCIFNFSALNNSRHCFHLEFSIDGQDYDNVLDAPNKTILEGFFVQRILLPIKRFSLFQNENQNQNLEESCRSLLNRIRVKYTLASRKTQGELWLFNPKIASSSLLRIVKPTSKFKVTLRFGDDFGCKLFVPPEKLITIDVELEIPENSPKDDMKLRMILYKDSGQGLYSFALQHQAVMIGSWCVPVKGCISTAMMMKHSANVMFLTPGRFKIYSFLQRYIYGENDNTISENHDIYSENEIIVQKKFED